MSHLQSSQSQRKQVMSGLGAIKRDFSSNSVLSSSQTSSTSALRSKELSMDAQKRRLKAIEEALGQGHRSETKADRVGSTIPSSSQSNPWTSSSSSSQKRASPSDDGPAPKRRQLPSTWEKDKELTASSGFVKSGKKTVAKATGKSSKRSGSGKIELSKEQEHILNLVKEGNSVFYTGSAGKSTSLVTCINAHIC
ncbi:hypothetical protein C8Q75DRAFT_622954 [Abortiporus biennis]|nr:hypothetical protein C8Q75DRAFT_622954 [Abortiporus biennis]